MRLAYLDCFSGISGDMALGALVHAGADLDAVVAELDTLPIDCFLVEREEVEDHGIRATRIHVKVRPQGVIRTYSSVRQMLEESSLPPGPRRMAGRVFHRLADGEKRLGEGLRSAVRHLGLVRFDAFEDMGGRLSFSAALLDDNGDGIVITSINGRQDTRCYAKTVQRGTSIHNLSDEEEQAIREAMTGRRATSAAR